MEPNKLLWAFNEYIAFTDAAQQYLAYLLSGRESEVFL